MSSDPANDATRSIMRVVGFGLMVASVLWIVFCVLMAIGISIAWIAEEGLTDELRPWIIVALATGAFYALVGLGVFAIGRWLRNRPLRDRVP